MEQDIKNLTEIIELSKEEIENNNENVTAILDLEDLKSLKNILDNYNLIKISKEETKGLLENSISKKQIQDKIDELKEELQYSTIANEARIQIRLLESILKGK